jgi:hypothetical protein
MEGEEMEKEIGEGFGDIELTLVDQWSASVATIPQQ